MLLAAVVAGCDLTGQYDADLKKAIQESERRAAFDLTLHRDYTENFDQAKEVKLRIPKVFDDKSAWLKLTDAKAKLPFVELPGLEAVLERALDDESNQFLGTYFYFAATPKGDKKGEVVQNALAQQIAAAFPGATWSEVQVNKPNGETLTLRRLRVEGQQPFFNAGKKAMAKADGRFDLYYLDGGGRHVFLAWRVPKAQGQKYKLEPAIEAAMGTVEVTPSADASGKKGPGAAGCF